MVNIGLENRLLAEIRCQCSSVREERRF